MGQGGERFGKRASILITKETSKGASLTTQCLCGDYFGLLTSVKSLVRLVHIQTSS